MNSNELFSLSLGLESPWIISKLDLNAKLTEFVTNGKDASTVEQFVQVLKSK